MIIVSAIITAKKGNRNEIIAKSQNVIESTRKEEGCISYQLYASTEDVDVLLMFERWANMESLESHMKTEHFKEFGQAIEDILAKEIEIGIYNAEEA
jgi:quinol monooxygenase YgiN